MNCQAKCDSCSGAVRRYRVTGYGTVNIFVVCDAVVAEDEANGYSYAEI